MPRAALGIGALLLAVVSCALGLLWFALLGVDLGTHAVLYLIYWRDKSAALQGRSRSRTPEKNPHLDDLLGGWPGALIARQQFHQKTAKASFQWMVWLIAGLKLAACVWPIRSGLAVALTQSLMD